MQEERQPSSLTLIDPRIFQLASAMSMLSSYIWFFFHQSHCISSLFLHLVLQCLRLLKVELLTHRKTERGFPSLASHIFPCQKPPPDFRRCQSIFKDVLFQSHRTGLFRNTRTALNLQVEIGLSSGSSNSTTISWSSLMYSLGLPPKKNLRTRRRSNDDLKPQQDFGWNMVETMWYISSSKVAKIPGMRWLLKYWLFARNMFP